MNQNREKSRQIEHDLRQASSGNEFKLYYQPIVSLQDGRTYKMEALIRWHHPERGLVYPDEFIPVAERTGQIIEIGRFVLEQACTDFNAIKTIYPILETIAVNFSARQFRDKNFAESVASITKRHMISNECIEIEITESLFIEKEDNTTRETLDKLKALGFKTSLDDFGTGFSSLGYLKQLSMDTLKIDRSFVRDITVDREDLTLVTSIIDLAHNFKLAVVAEGVEEEAQEVILKAHGCDFVQGDYYARPTSIEDLIANAADCSQK
jgi:EAL domain-containing protein (putative c-di-GMP-specific phosphodiesterase class I)